MELDRIQQKVWNGEKLSDDEFSALERAAQTQGGPSLRTAVAQALINADAPTQALPILEAVHRDFPRDLQALLALGRAFVSLEKWKDAEKPLNQALTLNPGDPEALKALAVVDLRRGELARARKRIEDVLEQDPFDGEAQALAAELEALSPAESAPASEVTREAFVSALLGTLRQRSTPHLAQKSHLLVRVGRGVSRLSLDGLYDEFKESGRPLGEAVEAMATELAERVLGLPPGKLPLLARVLPVVRDTAFLERGVGAARREGPAGLWIFYAIDDPELVRYVPEGVLAAYHLSVDELDEAAWKNLEARPAEVRALDLEQGALRLSSTPTGLWALAQGDGHDAARLLTKAHQAALEEKVGPPPWRVYLGLRELVLVCAELDRPTLVKLDGLDAARDGIAGSWRLAEGRLTQLNDWAKT